MTITQPTPAAQASPLLTPEEQTELDTLLQRISADFEVEFEPLQVDDHPLEVLAIRNMQAHVDALLRRKAVRNPLRDLPLWAKIWPGSFVLGRLLRKYEPKGTTLLELGAGCGVLSLVAARYGFARILLTDVVEQALLFARANVLRNGLSKRIATARLDVAAPGQSTILATGFDRIAASEILYLDELHRPLVKFVARHLAPGGKAFFCTDMARAKPRFAKLAAKCFHVSEGHIGVTTHDDDGLEQRRIYNILILERP
ncbi:MAG: 50S ribosomal protein L11 methyltransferase [Desulfovibrio sp.]|nr:50S ribosomal protein L11 methyltransferase [Desulfovibrio sp.]